MEKRDFKVKVVELRGLTNERENKRLDEVLQQKTKWAQTYDEGGYRYGMMTTNIPEVFNNVLKGIRAMPVSAIVEY